MDEYERKDVIRQPEILEPETDKELIYRFASELYQTVGSIVGQVDCDKILGQTKCMKCDLYRNDKCDMVRIKEAAHSIMWAVKPEKPKDYPKYK
jgi:hypothetical protein